MKPVGLLLAPVGAGKGVVGCAEHGHEDLRLAELTRVRVDDGHRWTTVIHEQLFPGAMDLAHAALLTAQPDPVVVAELGIAVAIVGMALAILLGDTFAFQLLADHRKVRLHKATLPGDRLGGKQQTPQTPFIQAVGNRPAQPGLLDPVQVLHHRAIADIQGTGDAAVGQSRFMAKPQNVFDFAH